MSVQLTNDTTDESTESTEQQYPQNATELCAWLDDQPCFLTIERTRRVHSRDSGTAANWGYRDKDVTEQMYVSPDYSDSTRACHNSQNDVMAAWEEMQFPSHRIETVQGLTGAYLYSWSSAGNAPLGRLRGRRGRTGDDNESVINFDAVQHPHGHGVVQHYSTIAAIRTRNGLVIANEQDYAGGFAELTTPDDADATLPLTGIDDILSGKPESLYDITEIVRDAVSIRPEREYNSETGDWETTGFRPTRSNEQPTLLRLSTGAAVMMLIDSTANNRNERKCGFYIPAEEASLYETATEAARSLQPVMVQQAVNTDRFDITPADEFAGDGATYGNDDLLGDTIIRQGEWYLVPMPEDWTPETPIHKALPKANRDTPWDFSHIGEAEYFGVDDVIGEFPGTDGCPACGEANFHLEARQPLAECRDCGESFAFGSIDPEDFIDEDIAAGYTGALDTLDSHTPRDLAVDDGDIFIRGTYRHVDNEHQMLNLDDHWHLAVENTRDVTVFDLNLDRGGIARVE